MHKHRAMKYAASIITSLRLAGAFILFVIKPLSVAFYIVYALCCVSDVLDGYIARKTHTVTKLGAMLDSIADFTLITVSLIIFIPLIAWEAWMLWWAGAIALARILSLGLGFAKYHTFAFLHTYANKAAGIVCACFPILYHTLGLTVTAAVLCGTASLSALEELIIIVSSKELDQNTQGLFC
ncbi:MAG TPA: CDP-alcohol phosphatidyltransferase [Ruminococcaceae bacterium]|nr:CDP-alcohol phosphatidyltransferase [Oscillospiraceae bacterium]